MEPVQPAVHTLSSHAVLPSPSPFFPITSWADQVEADLSRKQSYKSFKDCNSNQSCKRRRFQLPHKPHKKQSNNNYQHKNNDNKRPAEEQVASPNPLTSITPQLIDNTTITSSTFAAENTSDPQPQPKPHPPQQQSTSGDKKKARKKRKRRDNPDEDGKKIFVGGISFEDAGYTVSNDNQTLAYLRSSKFSQIFYNFGKVKRIQGHWQSGFCFVVYSTRHSAKQAVKYLSMYVIRKKIVKDLRDNVAAQGVLPLPSFYVRWPENKRGGQPSSTPSSTDDNDVEMLEHEVEKLLQDLKVSCNKDDDDEYDDGDSMEDDTSVETPPIVCRSM